MTFGFAFKLESFPYSFDNSGAISMWTEIKREKDKWFLKTSKNTKFIAPNIVIAGGVGSFEPRKFSAKGSEKFEGKSILYSVKDKSN